MANILIKMAEIRDLTPSERHVVEYILDHYKEVCSLGIREHGDSVTRSGGLYLQADALELGIARDDV